MLLSAKWLVDLTFTKRAPELAHRLRQTFGDDAIRVASNHAKFSMLGNDDWKVVIQTSMNLNYNPRFENFEISNDIELYEFHEAIIEDIWRKQKRDLSEAKPYQIEKAFKKDL